MYEFVATVGGNLGLFVGVSFLSVVEIFYWIIRCFFKFTKTE